MLRNLLARIHNELHVGLFHKYSPFSPKILPGGSYEYIFTESTSTITIVTPVLIRNFKAILFSDDHPEVCGCGKKLLRKTVVFSWNFSGEVSYRDVYYCGTCDETPPDRAGIQVWTGHRTLR